MHTAGRHDQTKSLRWKKFQVLFEMSTNQCFKGKWIWKIFLFLLNHPKILPGTCQVPYYGNSCLYCNIEVWLWFCKGETETKTCIEIYLNCIKNVLQLIVDHPVRTWYSKKIRVPYESDASNDTNWEIITSCRVLSIERLNYTIIWKLHIYVPVSIISINYFLLCVKCDWNY